MPVPLPVPDRAAALARLTEPPEPRRGLYRRGDPHEPGPPHDRDPDGVGSQGGAPDAAPDGPMDDGHVRPVRRSRPVAQAWHRPIRERWAGPAAGRTGATPLVVGGIVVLAVVAVVLAWPLLRRPAAADAVLPRASSDPLTSTVAATADAAGAADAGGTAPSAGPTGPTTTTSAPASDVTVHVAGAVASPGVVSLPPGSRVVDAVAAAGGLRPDAESDRVNLAAKLVDGQRILVPVLGQPLPAEVVAPAAGAGVAPGSAAGGSGTVGAPAGPVDLNAATADELDGLPGVGPATAAAILDHRGRNGPFRSVEDLLDVRGIGEAKLDALRDLVVVGG